MTTVVVEYAHDPPLTDEALATLVSKLTRCLEVREVVIRHRYVAADRKTSYAVYEVPAASIIAMVHQMVDVPYHRLTIVTEV